MRSVQKIPAGTINNVRPLSALKRSELFFCSATTQLCRIFQQVLDVEFKKHNIPVLDNVFLTFLSVAAGFFDFLFRTVFKKIIKAIHFRFDKAALKIGVDNSGCVGGGISCVDCPRTAFVFSSSKKGTQPNQMVRSMSQYR